MQSVPATIRHRPITSETRSVSDSSPPHKQPSPERIGAGNESFSVVTSTTSLVRYRKSVDGVLDALHHVNDAVIQFTLRAVTGSGGDDPATLAALQLPSAVGSLQAEGIFLPHLVAEHGVQFDHGTIQILDGDSVAHSDAHVVPFSSCPSETRCP